MICWIASYPRSGNTLARIIIHGATGEPTSSIYEDPGPDDPDRSDLVAWATLPRDYQTDPRTFFVKTHEPLSWSPAERDERAIYLVRDGRDALVSHAHMRSRKDPEGRSFTQWLEMGMEEPPGWSAHVDGWTGADGVVTIRFEDLILDPFVLVNALSRWYPVRGVDRIEFQALHSQYPHFFRAGRVGAWQEEMPAKMAAEFSRRHGATLARWGYTP